MGTSLSDTGINTSFLLGHCLSDTSDGKRLDLGALIAGLCSVLVCLSLCYGEEAEDMPSAMEQGLFSLEDFFEFL